VRAPLDPAAARLWLQKWFRYQRNELPWNRACIHYELARRQAFAKWPLHGDVLEALGDGRLSIGPQAHFESGVWLTCPRPGRITIGSGSFLNMGVMVAALDHVQIGEHCMFANGCFITDADHRFDDPEVPVPWQGFTSKGPTTIEDNVWCGVNVAIGSGVTIGERSVIGANSVVTSNIPAFSVAAGSPARVIKQIEYGRPQ
jgi:acetyltransferase-like isoleucine patch superfamily enzyme